MTVTPSKVLSRSIAAVGDRLPERIVLIGYRASGKTSVGISLSNLLSWRFLDLDEEIEREAGCTIDRIVERGGWDEFRNIEQTTIKKLCKKPQYVIAPGGGAVMNADNVVNLKRKSRVFWLQADAATLLARMKDDPLSPSRRPPLTGLSPEKEVERLLQEREPFYKEASDTIIETQDRSIREVVEKILSALKA